MGDPLLDLFTEPCSMCGTEHLRVRGKGWLLSVGGKPVCSTLCMARAWLGLPGKVST